MYVATQTYLQVQLLVTKDEHENYKGIKSNLDQLRLLVEKSELWVMKGKSSSSQSSHEATSRETRREDSTSSTSSMPVVSDYSHSKSAFLLTNVLFFELKQFLYLPIF